MSWLARTAGLSDVPPDQRPTDVLEAHARLFLAAGGSLTPDAWADMDTRERAACVSASERLEAERVRDFARALNGDTTELAKKIGGERARTREILAREAVR